MGALYTRCWYVRKATANLLLSHGCLSSRAALWSCASLFDGQKSWRKGQNFKFSKGSKRKRWRVRRNVDVGWPQPVNITVNSMGIFDVTERTLLFARRESVVLGTLFPVPIERTDIPYCVGNGSCLSGTCWVTCSSQLPFRHLPLHSRQM